jgi:hypothetical protein
MQIFVESEVNSYKIHLLGYSMIYKDNCSIGSAGVRHLSKAQWRRADYVTLGNMIFMKEPTNSSVKTLST